MKKVHYSIQINTTPEKVWGVLFDKELYKQWTAPFNPGGSWYEGEIVDGGEILFLGPSEDGKSSGMMSRIVKLIPGEYISFYHYGIIANGVQDTTSDMAKKWTDGYENYTLIPNEHGTEFIAELDLEEEFITMMNDAWPQALEILKKLSEEN